MTFFETVLKVSNSTKCNYKTFADKRLEDMLSMLPTKTKRKAKTQITKGTYIKKCALCKVVPVIADKTIYAKYEFTDVGICVDCRNDIEQ